MLVLNEIRKTYRTKKGVEHEALKGITLTFPQVGFIVLLGKSGSGKSTLLNIIGGFDDFDSGEIAIKGKSTKDFTGSEWDSYRNTYVGFIFQEFYMIDEFSLGKNISLALELQGEKRDEVDQRVNEILKRVDLEGFKDRKTNEISGGQKQRIAIARALVKDPQVILADEPTGNLDSETGQLILETLKNLSKEKLVIMVTHDEDFAKAYGDRIIELKDGAVIRDEQNQTTNEEEHVYRAKGPYQTILRLKKGQPLTPEDITRINELLKTQRKGFYLTVTKDKHVIDPFITNRVESKVDKSEVTDEFHLIRSQLTFRSALTIAFSSLVHKKIRLVLMILLFMVSLTFVGISTSFTFYNVPKAAALTFEKAGERILPLIHEVQVPCGGDNNYEGSCYERSTVPCETIDTLKEQFPGINYAKGMPKEIGFEAFNENHQVIDNREWYNRDSYYSDYFSQILIAPMDFPINILYGTSLQSTNEVLISDYMAESLLHYELIEGVETNEQLIGKVLNYYGATELRIAGIYETDAHKYAYLKEITDEKSHRYSSFNPEYERGYLWLVMSKDTYESLYRFTSMYFDYHPLNDLEVTLSQFTYAFSNKLIEGSRLPKENNEILISRGTLDLMGLNDHALGQTHNLNFDRYEIIGDMMSSSDGAIRKNYRIVGIINSDQSIIMLNDSVYEELYQKSQEYARNEAGVSDSEVYAILSQSRKVNEKFFHVIKDYDLIHEAETLSWIIYQLEYYTTEGRKPFIILGGIFALFASFLLLTFISSSIKAKQKDIGTLRAIGARGHDIAKIFVTEGLLISLITFIISLVSTSISMRWLNSEITYAFKVDLVLVYMNFFSVFCLLFISLTIVFLSTLLPIHRISRMKPIEAIKKD